MKHMNYKFFTIREVMAHYHQATTENQSDWCKPTQM